MNWNIKTHLFWRQKPPYLNAYYMKIVWTVLNTTSIIYYVNIFVIILNVPCKYHESVQTSTVSFLNSFTKQWYSTFLQLLYFCISEHFFLWDALIHSSLFAGHFWTTCCVSFDFKQIWARDSSWKEKKV